MCLYTCKISTVFKLVGFGEPSQHLPSDDRQHRAGQDVGRRHRFDGHHRGLRRVQDRQDPAVAHPLRHDPDARFVVGLLVRLLIALTAHLMAALIRDEKCVAAFNLTFYFSFLF